MKTRIVRRKKKSFGVKKVCIALLLLFGLIFFRDVTNRHSSLAATKTIRVVVDGKVNTCKAEQKKDDFYVKSEDVKKILSLSKPVGKTSGYVALDKVAKKANIYYKCDPILDAAYFWTDEIYGEEDYVHAFDHLLVSASLQKKRDKVITSTQFRSLLINLINKQNKKGVSYFKKNVRTYKKKLKKGEAIVMAYYAAKAIGGKALSMTYEFDSDLTKKGPGGNDAFWNDSPFAFEKLFPNCKKGKVKLGGDTWENDRTAAYIWLFWHACGDDDRQMLPFDYKKYHFHLTEYTTYQTAIAMLNRLYESSQGEKKAYVKTSDKKATTPDGVILSSKLLDKAGKKKELTEKDLPRMTGLVLGNVYRSPYEIHATEYDLKSISQWGFNTVRVMFDYIALYDEEATKVDVNKLKELDKLVAAAIRYNLHLNILLNGIPGHWTRVTEGEFHGRVSDDIFVNEEHLNQAKEVWRVLAERYKNVPSAYLSFMPFWEAMNKGLSSGEKTPDYTTADVEHAMVVLMDGIREADPNRFIIYEPGCKTDDSWSECFLDTYRHISVKYDNVLVMTNYGEEPYIYQEMTGDQNGNVDVENHGMFKNEYPNYIAAVAQSISSEKPMTIDGFLPKGTTMNMYLTYSRYNSRLSIKADGVELYSETLPDKQYAKTTVPMYGHYPFAESEKKISVTLPNDTKTLEITFAEPNGKIDISGIELLMPEEYAVEKLWYPSYYDISIGLETQAKDSIPYWKKTSRVTIGPNMYEAEVGYHLTISRDFTYTSDAVYEKADAETVHQFFSRLHEHCPRACFRYEGGQFLLGTPEDSLERYYSDIFKEAEAYGFSWFSNDFEWLTETNDEQRKVLGYKVVNYGKYHLCTNLLSFLQNHQNNERV